MRIACVVNGALDLDATEALVVRRTVATLVASDHDVAVLRSSPAEGPRWDLGLRSHDFAGTSAQPVRRKILDLVLHPPALEHEPTCACRGPAVSTSDTLEQEYLTALGGRSERLDRHVESADYDAVVFFGLVSPTAEVITRLAGRTRLVLAPMLSDPALAALPRSRTTLAAADAIVAFNEVEAEACGGGLDDVVPLALRVDPGALAGTPRGVPAREFVLVLGPWHDPVRGTGWVRHAARLARLVPDVETVVVTDQFIWPDRWPPELLVRGSGSRADLWRWMHRARAVIDLDPHPLVARDVLEAMMIGVPVLVPDTSTAARHVCRAGGGVPFRGLTDVAVAVRALADSGTRARLGQLGASYASRHAELDACGDAILRQLEHVSS